MPSDGQVVAIRGAVIDIAFADTDLPAIDHALRIDGAGQQPVLAEVQAHLDQHTVRAIALQATTGLKRGDPVIRLGGPVTVPVGDMPQDVRRNDRASHGTHGRTAIVIPTTDDTVRMWSHRVSFPYSTFMSSLATSRRRSSRPRSHRRRPR